MSEERGTYLSALRWQVPDVDDESPAGHEVEEVTQQRVTTAVPERIGKPRVILDVPTTLQNCDCQTIHNISKILQRKRTR